MNELKEPQIKLLPLRTAEQWTENWRNLIKGLVPPGGLSEINEIRAFNMTLKEIEDAITPIDGNKPVSARLYLGCTSETPTSPADFKLMIVGVDKDGNDLLDFIGDFSHPCPTYCDPNSPLNGNVLST